jgi:hypothetical protein
MKQTNERLCVLADLEMIRTQGAEAAYKSCL